MLSSSQQWLIKKRDFIAFSDNAWIPQWRSILYWDSNEGHTAVPRWGVLCISSDTGAKQLFLGVIGLFKTVFMVI